MAEEVAKLDEPATEQPQTETDNIDLLTTHDKPLDGSTDNIMSETNSIKEGDNLCTAAANDIQTESPGEHKVEDNDDTTTINNVDNGEQSSDILINLGVNNDMSTTDNTEVINQDIAPATKDDVLNNSQETTSASAQQPESNDFDLLGFPQTQQTPIQSNGVFGDDNTQEVDITENNDTMINDTKVEITNDLLGISTGEDTNINTTDEKQQEEQNSDINDKINNKPQQTVPAEEQGISEEIVKSSDTSSNQIIPEGDSAIESEQPTSTINKEEDAQISVMEDKKAVEEEKSPVQVEETVEEQSPSIDKAEGSESAVKTVEDETPQATIVEMPPTSTNSVETSTQIANEVKDVTTLVDLPKISPTVETTSVLSPPTTVESTENINEVAEQRTEEEEEWISMGLGLGDALRQIVTLTEERDSALMICQEKDNSTTQAEALLVEVQSRLEAEMNRRAESDSQNRKVRETLKSYEERLAAYEKMEDELEQVQANLVTVVSEKSKIELEVAKLREIRDDSAQKEVVLANRLNDAKKKEANKSTAAGRLEADNEQLRDDLQKTKEELETTTKAKTRLENNMEKLKSKAVERVKQAETALSEERELNEERKKKMKVFVETKADELREAKDSANDMQKELEETRSSLRSSRDREEAFQKELDEARLKYREVQRDMERMKRNSEQARQMQHQQELEMEKSMSESEEHKKKRMSAKHEIMQMVRTLDAERAVSSKLRESVKFTFTPKALSQQQLLTECLRDFEMELERLAHKTGKTLQSSDQAHNIQSDGAESSNINGVAKKSKKNRSKADMDTERLISNLEHETQSVSKGIMQLSSSIERMRSLLGEDSFGCVAYFSNIVTAQVSQLQGTGEARHQRLGDSDNDQDERANSDHFV